MNLLYARLGRKIAMQSILCRPHLSNAFMKMPPHRASNRRRAYHESAHPFRKDRFMLRRLILSRITAAEKTLGVPLDYCRFIIRTSLRASFKFAKFLAVDEYRSVLPAAPCYVARIVAVQHD